MNISKNKKHIILLMDFAIYAVVSFIMFTIGNYDSGLNYTWMAKHFMLMFGCTFLFQIIFRTYDSLWRYAGTREYFLLFKGMFCGLFSYLIIIIILGNSRYWILQAVSSASTSLVIMLLIRFVYRLYRKKVIYNNIYENNGKTYIAIIGAGGAGANLMREITSNPSGKYIPYYFIDDDTEKHGKTISGIPIKGPIKDFKKILKGSPVTEIILAIPSLSPKRRKEILKMFSETKYTLRILPESIITKKGNSYTAGIRDVSIDDLLGRSSVRLNNPKVNQLIENKTIMVTGGGGSIGSELCRQISGLKPKRLVLVDISENGSYEIQQDILHNMGKDFPISIEIASVRDIKKINELFEKYRPAIVFHAAAHKHVPLMENCPEEAVKNNIFGTYNVANAAKKYHAEKFVLISTDKAVNPTNVMGASKCFCEKILQSVRSDTDTVFAAVRFGNVLGSNGSVIPLFKKQIAYGGPVTVTDKRIIRYFMTIPEAVQLVLQAGSMAKSGEIYVLDMGDPVKIYDLAENLIRLSGFTPHHDIQIIETGLRPGEKLYEELLTKSGDLHKTENDKIFVEYQKEINSEYIDNAIKDLAEVVKNNDREKIVEAIHKYVPTFLDPDTVNEKAIEIMENKKSKY
ncbi:polysaccharide biosynthesis protein [Tyzzerella sp. An114]|uniref:polysaccharide biosynthesis protein n=1 Tax=Tyzzerella sp. An114 TaxID=1965545 RepID=UPI001FA85995|nr:nucleoside-diphosphate sugar epimerase/dehydratase [Tyzzerella sp. An114]